MVKKCEKCGKTLKKFDDVRYYKEKDKLISVCNNCYEQLEIDREKIVKEERIKQEKEEKKREELSFRENISESQLSLPEMQLQFLNELRDDMKSVKNDIHTISTIVLIWFIIGIISLLISLISILSIIT